MRGSLPSASVPNVLRTAHAFLMPSVQEGFCNAVLEAQAMELPVVATDAEGLAENVDPGKTGLIVPRWSVTAIADGLEYLLLHPERCSEFGKAGRRRAEALFDISDQIDKFEELYASVIVQHALNAARGSAGKDTPA